MASRYSKALAAIFDAYGDDVDAALVAFANTANEEWSTYSDNAVRKQYLADLASHVRSQTVDVDFANLNVRSEIAGEPRLFDPGPAMTQRVTLREFVVHAGHRYALADLSGLAGAQILRAVALRDRKPAKTALVRCQRDLALADHIEAETERLGRPVSAAEVLGLAA